MTPAAIELTDSGRLFVQYARTPGGQPLALEDMVQGLYPDDLTDPVVRVISKLTWPERARQFGVEALDIQPSVQSGRRGPQGHHIPTEEYISRVGRVYGDDRETRTVGLDPYRRLPLVAAINRAGNDLSDLLSAGGYEVSP